MKLTKILATSVVLTFIITNTAMAADSSTQVGNSNVKKTTISKNLKMKGQKDPLSNDGKMNSKDNKNKGFYGQRKGPQLGRGPEQDPLKRLEERKTRIQTDLTNGKITQENATAEIAKIEAETLKINEFNALTLEQKKEKLTTEFKTNIQKQVTDTKLTQVKADEIIKDFTDKLAKWDGTGNPGFGMGGKLERGGPREQGKGPQQGRGPEQDPLKRLEERKTRIQTDLTNGKITQENATAEIAKIEAETLKINEFNALTLEQKKEKLTTEFKTNIQKQVTDTKLTQVKADEMIKDFTDKLAKWDGTGNPGFGMGKRAEKVGRRGSNNIKSHK